MDEIKEIFGRINLAMERFSGNLESKVKTLLHQLNDGLKKLKLNKEEDQKQQYQEKLLLLFRKTLSELMKNWSNQESEETSNSIKVLLKLIFWCAKKEIVLVKDALSFSEEFCDMLSVNDLREFIDTFEKSIHTIHYLSEQDSNYPLKICNVIFKKLTRTYDTRLRGELHIFLSKILPICHASGLKSKICTETTAQVETIAETKEQAINGMEIEDDKGSSESITYPNREFYKKFWTLQKYFQNPLNLSVPNDLNENEKIQSSSSTAIEEEEVEEGEEKLIESKKIKAVCAAICQVLDRFNQNPVFEKRETNIKPYIKYLTTYSLLEKQLNDQFFRKIWLLQALLFFNAIQNKTKDLEIKNIDSDQTLIKSIEDKVKVAFILLHKNLKEEINIEKLDLFFADEKIWVERKDMLPRQNKDEKYNFKNPCEKIKEMIEYYHKSVLMQKEDQKNGEFSYDSHNMLLQKQFADMEAFKKKLIADCSKTGGNTITQDSKIKQILGGQMVFPIKTDPIQKSVGFYIEQVIGDLKSSTSEKKIDNTTFVTKAMRSISRYSLNWVDKDKDNNLKDLEDFAKEIIDKDGDKVNKVDKESRDKSTTKEQQQQPEQMQIEETKKIKSERPEKISRNTNDNEDTQENIINHNSSVSSQRGDDKGHGQSSKSSNNGDKIKLIEHPRNNNSVNPVSSSSSASNNKEKMFTSQAVNNNTSINGLKVVEDQKTRGNDDSRIKGNDDQKARSNDDQKTRGNDEQKGRSNDDRPRRDDKGERYTSSSNNNEGNKQDVHDGNNNQSFSRSNRSDNERDRTLSQDISRQHYDEKQSSRGDNYNQQHIEKSQSKIDDKSNNQDLRNDEINKPSNKDDKPRGDDRNSQSSQSRQQVILKSDKNDNNLLIKNQNQQQQQQQPSQQNKNDDKQKKSENRQKEDSGRQQQTEEDSKKHQGDDSRKIISKDDVKRTHNDDIRKSNQNDLGNEKNDSHRQSSSGNNSSRQTSTQSSNFSSKSDNKQGDDTKYAQNVSQSSVSINQNSGNSNSGQKPQLVLKKVELPSNSSNAVNSQSIGSANTMNITGTILFKEPQIMRSHSKEKSSGSYLNINSGSSRGGTNNNSSSSNSSQYNSGNNANMNSATSNNSSFSSGSFNNNNISKYNQRDDNKQSGYNQSNNSYNQNNSSYKGGSGAGNNNGMNSNNYQNKRDYSNNNNNNSNNNNNNNGQYDNKRDNYERKNYQGNNNNYHTNRNNDYDSGPHKKQKN